MGRRKRSLLSGGHRSPSDSFSDQDDFTGEEPLATGEEPLPTGEEPLPTGEEPLPTAEGPLPTGSESLASPPADGPPARPGALTSAPPEPTAEPAAVAEPSFVPPEPPEPFVPAEPSLPAPAPVGEAVPVPPVPEAAAAVPDDDPSVIGGDEFSKALAFGNPSERPDAPTEKADEDDDDWYARTGAPAPTREDEEGMPSSRPSDLQHYGPALALIGGIVLLVLLILLFGVLLG